METIRASTDQRAFERYSEFYRQSWYGKFEQTHGSFGSFGAECMRVEQSEIDVIDPAMPIVVFCAGLRSGGFSAVDLGDGLQQGVHVRGSVLTYPAGVEAHSIVHSPHAILTVSVPVTGFATMLGGRSLSGTELPHTYGNLQFRPQAFALMNRLWRASRGGTLADILLADGLLLQLVATLCRSSGPISDIGAGCEDRRVRRAVDYIEAHIGQPFGIADLARIACLSPGHFSRVFKAQTGQTVWQYVMERRRTKAVEILAGSRIPIRDVALACGFADQAHLSRTVKAATGLTPKQVRNGGHVQSLS